MKMKLNNLTINSFMTSMNEEQANTAKGGKSHQTCTVSISLTNYTLLTCPIQTCFCSAATCPVEK